MLCDIHGNSMVRVHVKKILSTRVCVMFEVWMAYQDVLQLLYFVKVYILCPCFLKNVLGTTRHPVSHPQASAVLLSVCDVANEP